MAAINARNIERSIRALVSFGTRNTLSSQSDPKRGIGAARDWLYNEFLKIKRESGGRLTVEKQSFEQPAGRRVPHPTIITNVVARLEGSLPDPEKRVYVISGHYDSMCTSPVDADCDAPGANDDASGTAAVLEIARVMSQHEFPGTIIFMSVAGEEQGLLGSIHFAEESKRNGWNIEAMLDNDIIGSSTSEKGVRDARSVRVFSEGVPSNETSDEAVIRRAVGGENDSSSRQLARFIKEVGEQYVKGINVWLISRRDRYLRGGDHIPFLEKGYPAVRFTEPNEDYRHQHQNVRSENGVQYGDLTQFDDFEYIAQVSRINAAALSMLALAPATPRKVQLLTRRLTNDTELQWAASTDAYISGYEIVWRDTTSSVWTNSKPVGKVTTVTMHDMSKDNYFFGVRAIDALGNRSPVAFPQPNGNLPPAAPPLPSR